MSARQLPKAQTGIEEVDRYLGLLSDVLNPVLRASSLPGGFRWVEVAGQAGAPPTFALQLAQPGGAWKTIDTFDSNGLLVQPAWTAVLGGVGFQNAWVNFGAPAEAVSFMQDSFGVVKIRGAGKTGTIGLPAFTLPAAYRPKNQRSFAICSNGAFGQLNVAANGDVVPAIGSNVVFHFECSFDTR